METSMVQKNKERSRNPSLCNKKHFFALLLLHVSATFICSFQLYCLCCLCNVHDIKDCSLAMSIVFTGGNYTI